MTASGGFTCVRSAAKIWRERAREYSRHCGCARVGGGWRTEAVRPCLAVVVRVHDRLHCARLLQAAPHGRCLVALHHPSHRVPFRLVSRLATLRTWHAPVPAITPPVCRPCAHVVDGSRYDSALSRSPGTVQFGRFTEGCRVAVHKRRASATPGASRPSPAVHDPA